MASFSVIACIIAAHSAGCGNSWVTGMVGISEAIEISFIFCSELRELGIVDVNGNQLKTLVPADMLDAKTDFGG
jgi:hypothetical protein